jgi:hypothetical protein
MTIDHEIDYAPRKRWFWRVVKVLAVMLAVGLLWALWRWPTYTFRYRLTISVETPDGLRAGSSVIEVKKSYGLQLNGGGDVIHTEVQGEGVFVDLGRGQHLVVTLTDRSPSRTWGRKTGPRDAGHLAELAFEIRYDMDKIAGDLAAAYKAGPAELDSARLPLTVRFRDLMDPVTVEEVDPANLAASFGEGFRMLPATVELRVENLNATLDRRLPWLSQYYGKRLDGNRYGTNEATNKFANSLSAGAFSTLEVPDNE